MSGYTYQFDVYQGKIDGDESDQTPLGHRVVAELCKPLHNDGYKVVFDRFFTSLPLLTELAKKGVMACGTILTNRKGQPTMAKEKDLPRGHYEGRINQLKRLSLYVWKQKFGSRSIEFSRHRAGTG